MKRDKYRIIFFLLLAFTITIRVFPQAEGDSITLTQQVFDSLENIVTQEPVEDTTVQSESFDARIVNTIDELKAPGLKKIISARKIIWSIIIVLLGYLFFLILEKILNRYAEASTRRRASIKRIIPIVKIFGWVIIIYIIVEGVFNPPYASVLAFFTSIGVAVGFASQDLLKNVFGGLIILFDRPFQLGDKIEAKSHYGEVVKIGLRSTKIVTADDSTVTIPNSEVMTGTVSNANSGESNCQVVAEIYLPIDVDTEAVRIIATEAAQVSKYIFLGKPIVVLFFNEIKQRRSYLKMRIKAYVMDLRYEFVFNSEMTEIVIRELLKQGLINKEDLF